MFSISTHICSGEVLIFHGGIKKTNANLCLRRLPFNNTMVPDVGTYCHHFVSNGLKPPPSCCIITAFRTLVKTIPHQEQGNKGEE